MKQVEILKFDLIQLFQNGTFRFRALYNLSIFCYFSHFHSNQKFGKSSREKEGSSSVRPSFFKRTSDLFRAYVCQFSRYLIFLECESFCRHYFDQDKLSSGTTSY